MKENDRPPLSSSQRRKSRDSRSPSWRSETNDNNPIEAPSKGIDASSFHSTKHSRAAYPPKVKQALKDASTSVVKQKRREVSTSLRLQRSAFKQVTSLKTWPLQEMAVKDYDHILKIHYGNKEEEELLQQDGDVVVETHGDSTGLSSSSLDEPKRLRRRQVDDGEDLSPRKSTLRHEFQQEFLREAALEKPSPPSAFQKSLWCMEPRMFAVEKNASGKRKYMVGHLGRFLDYYWRKCDARHRHYYELIREKTPCRLYFDLEFSKAANPDITPELNEKLLEEFIVELSLEFERVYSLQFDRLCIVDLDSSTDKKFSRHLIVHLPNGALFADAAAAGRFVRILVGRLAEEAATGQLTERRQVLAKHLFVNTRPSLHDSNASDSPLTASTPEPDERRETTCFVDMGVYTRNRLFRLLGSSKFGKPASAALRISDTNTFPFPKGFTNDCFYVPAMEARVMENRNDQGDDDEEDEIYMDEEIKKFMSAVDWTDHATALGDTLVVPVNGTKLDLPILEESDEAKALIVVSPANSTPDSQLNAGGLGESRQTIATSSLQAGITPFPLVDYFIVNDLGCRGEVQGAIRAWSVENDAKGLPQFITYQMSRNRFCERLGRPHRSNNIMWTVDLQTMQCIQSCHDPDCRALRFRGAPVDLPPDVREAVADALFEQQLATMDEKELTTAPPKKEKEPTCDFDEEEFERALLALNINGDDKPSKESADEKKQPEPSTNEKVASADPSPSIELDPLSDEALLAAMASNPTLFP